MHALSSSYEIVFAYLHPLSSPGIAPSTTEIRPEAPINCQGDVVLRFGFLEGDAIVHGGRVIFDPQSSSAPISFYANGSSADSLAIVLNIDELRASMPSYPLPEAARELLKLNNADVVVIKCGPNGAVVLERGRNIAKVPAFRTSNIFKIGSGDVFSAAFAYYWGTERRSALEAAELASKSTAAYCSSQCLPIPTEKMLPAFNPIISDERLNIYIIGATDTLAHHWLMEESKWCINQLGRSATVYDAKLDELDKFPNQLTSVLVLADTLDDCGEGLIERAQECSLPVVVLRERDGNLGMSYPEVDITSDFTTALYWAVWA